MERTRREVEARGAPRVGRLERRAKRPDAWIAGHWLGSVNAITALLLGGTVLAPWLRARDHEWLAAALYGFYRLQCPQRPDHSFLVFGQKMAMEQRMVALYAGGLVAGLAFACLRRRLHPLPLIALIGAGVPMAADVGSQMIGLREGTWPWRVATGLLAAVGGAWWAFPRIEDGRHQASGLGGIEVGAPDNRDG